MQNRQKVVISLFYKNNLVIVACLEQLIQELTGMRFEDDDRVIPLTQNIVNA